jgi:hypothetical protein
MRRFARGTYEPIHTGEFAALARLPVVVPKSRSGSKKTFRVAHVDDGEASPLP